MQSDTDHCPICKSRVIEWGGIKQWWEINNHDDDKNTYRTDEVEEKEESEETATHQNANFNSDIESRSAGRDDDVSASFGPLSHIMIMG